MQRNLKAVIEPSSELRSGGVIESIERRLGFVPPFFLPAKDQVGLLKNLWKQTELAYLDNPLPALFKEKLATILGLYCEVPYCLVCHASMLRPLGMGGPAIRALLTRRAVHVEDIEAALQRIKDRGKVTFPLADAALEPDLFTLSSAVYFGGMVASLARKALRDALTVTDYNNLVLFISYNKTCHDWMAAHPEVSFELDERYTKNYAAILQEEPRLGQFLATLKPLSPVSDEEVVSSASSTAAKRAPEADRTIEIAERHLTEVLRSLRARVDDAVNEGMVKDELAAELRRTASFAQEVVAIVSHDLRNPLGAILMGATLAREQSEGHPDIQRTLDRVLSSGRRAERMLHDLLDFSQARAGGGIAMTFQSHSLSAIVQHSVNELMLAHPKRQILVDCPESIDIECDGDRISQMLGNLLANAIAHGAPEQPVRVDVHPGADAVEVVVSNANIRGPIPDALLSTLFEPFKRGRARMTSRQHGVGLGLYIVDQIVRGHHGSIRVRSDAQRTELIATLPIRQPAERRRPVITS